MIQDLDVIWWNLPFLMIQGFLGWAYILVADQRSAQSKPGRVGLRIVPDELLSQCDGLLHITLIEQHVCSNEQGLASGLKFERFLQERIGPRQIGRQFRQQVLFPFHGGAVALGLADDQQQDVGTLARVRARGGLLEPAKRRGPIAPLLGHPAVEPVTEDAAPRSGGMSILFQTVRLLLVGLSTT